MVWSRIILKIGDPIYGECPEPDAPGQKAINGTSKASRPIFGYNIVATNAATGSKVNLRVEASVVE